MDWNGVLERLSVPGLILLAAGAVLGYGARWLAPKLFAKGGDRAVVPMKVVGLALALLGALILLDIIPI